VGVWVYTYIYLEESTYIIYLEDGVANIFLFCSIFFNIYIPGGWDRDG
jgi:hypothetical protein